MQSHKNVHIVLGTTSRVHEEIHKQKAYRLAVDILILNIILVKTGQFKICRCKILKKQILQVEKSSQS